MVFMDPKGPGRKLAMLYAMVAPVLAAVNGYVAGHWWGLIIVLAGTWFGFGFLGDRSPRGYNPAPQFMICGLVNVTLVAISLRGLL